MNNRSAGASREESSQQSERLHALSTHIIAAQNGQAKALLEAHPELAQAWAYDQQEQRHWCALTTAVMHENEEVLRWLLPASDPNTMDRSGVNALMLAAKFGAVGCLRLLLPHSNPNLKSAQSGVVALEFALQRRKLEAAKYLAARTLFTPELTLRVLKWCVLRDEPAYLQAVLPYCDAKTQESDSGESPLMRAARAGHTEIVRLLLPHSNPNSVNKFGFTALLRAIENDEIECLNALLPVSDWTLLLDGKNAIECAVEWRSWQCADRLVSQLGTLKQAQDLSKNPVDIPLPMTRARLERQALASALNLNSEGKKGRSPPAVVESTHSTESPRSELSGGRRTRL